MRRIGTLEIDMNCPLDLTREFLRRAFWRELNEEAGAAFDFMQQGNTIREDDERSTRVSDIAPQRLDSITRELENMLIICASLNKERILLRP